MKNFQKVMAVTIIALLFSCSAKKTASDNIQLITDSSFEGTIVVVDNAPFSKLALQVNDSTSYYIECSESLTDSLLKEQGELYKIFFSEKIETQLGKKIVVSKIEKIK